MNIRLNSLPIQCYRVGVGLTRSLSKASDIRCTFSKTFTYSTLSSRTNINWQPCDSHLINVFQNKKPTGYNCFPNALSCRIIHLTPGISAGENPNKAKNLESSKSISSDQGKIRNESAEPVTLEKEQDSAVTDDQLESENVDVKPQSLLQRFRQTYKEYGKVLIGVHVFTSCIWGTAFYYAAVSGIDVISLLKWLGASDKMIAPFTVPGVGHAAIAYLIYKLATPLRYMVTIGGTRVAVRVLRRWGYLPPIAEKNKIRFLVKEGQQKMKERYGDIRKSKSEE